MKGKISNATKDTSSNKQQINNLVSHHDFQTLSRRHYNHNSRSSNVIKINCKVSPNIKASKTDIRTQNLSSKNAQKDYISKASHHDLNIPLNSFKNNTSSGDQTMFYAKTSWMKVVSQQQLSYFARDPTDLVYQHNNKYTNLWQWQHYVSTIFWANMYCLANVLFLKRRFLYFTIILLLFSKRLTLSKAVLAIETKYIGLPEIVANENQDYIVYNHTRHSKLLNSSGSINSKNNKRSDGAISTSLAVDAKGYLDKLDNLERSVAAVLIKVAYGTTSTTKRSIPDNGFVPGLTTMATPLLTTLRYLDKSPHQQQINLHHRNYELDLERDHALPTSAPNADILKSNSNPTYPNPNRHHSHDRERYRHTLNSTSLPSLPNIMKKNNGHLPTVPMYPGDIPSYSPPARSFFTPPLPPEYQNPFADKPTLRGTNNEGIVGSTGTYINRRPIPPPSLMPGHERIPLRPPDLAASTGENGTPVSPGLTVGFSSINPVSSGGTLSDVERKKALNTPSRSTVAQLPNSENKNYFDAKDKLSPKVQTNDDEPSTNSGRNTRKEVLPSIRRILSGSNGNKGEIPEVLLKQVTSRPFAIHHQPPQSPVVLLDTTSQQKVGDDNGLSSPNINKSRNKDQNGERTLDVSNLNSEEVQAQPKTKMSTKSTPYSYGNKAVNKNGISSTPSAAAAISETVVLAAGSTTTSSTTSVTYLSNNLTSISSPTNIGSSSSTSTAAAAAAHSTWSIAWNIHVYLTVVLFTILAVYSFFKMLTYNKLTHLISQSYFVCIHLFLIVICTARTFYLCYDAYNINSSFNIFVSEILLNLPATFLTVSFSVLILFLFLKSLNHKNNRYSALIRPLTVVVGCGVHVVLCITLHYVESYTMQNQQHFYYQQQQQLYRRQQQQHQQYVSSNLLSMPFIANNDGLPQLHTAAYVASSAPPRVLSLICQIIYIFICLSLGLLYLYLYRLLKRILRSKSQNYIHGYQNLSYAIHITIATALLFVLLAALQIFGAISISTTRPLITQTTADIDWLQWGYQFSLRLIEIAIITLISWVAGLKTSGGSGTIGIGNGDSRIGVGALGNNTMLGSGPGVTGREKHSHHHNNHTNVANFFLPCTSSSSQEQFDTDYPAVCNTNTNLHTYTMRTGKLIYDDSFALNSLASGGPSSQLGCGGAVGGRNNDFQLQQPTYQRPYDTGSINSLSNHHVEDYGQQSTLATGLGNRYHHDLHHQYAEYVTDATTDHYENPNFDLHVTSSGMASTMQKFAKTSTTSTTASSSGGSGSSGASQQQMLLLQSESCYSEPLQQNCNASNYNFSNFERPKFGDNTVGSSQRTLHGKRASTDKRDKIERSAYDNAERRNSNSTYYCTSGSVGRYASCNSFERGNYNGIRKSGTLNNIGGGNKIPPGHTAPSSSAASTNMSNVAMRQSGIQTLASSDRHYNYTQQQNYRSGRNGVNSVDVSHGTGNAVVREREQEAIFGRCSLERSNSQHTGQKQQHKSDDDVMIVGSNVEHTKLFDNEERCCVSSTNITNAISAGRNRIDQDACSNSANTDRFLKQALLETENSHSLARQTNQLTKFTQNANTTNSTSSGTSSSASESATSGSMLVAEHGFVRFRAIDDINNAQGVGIHNASIRNPNRNNSSNGDNMCAIENKKAAN